MGNGSRSSSASSSGSSTTDTDDFSAGALVGEQVAGHDLIRLLAVGGMGEVYLAKHQTLGVLRAIKVIREDMRGRHKSLERFTREAQVLTRLQHDAIVEIIDYGSLDNGWPFLAMEYVEGPTLEDMAERGRLSIPNALIVLEQMALALHHAHAHNVIHRDLKPSNVLVRSADVRQIKIIDFGLARILDDDGERLSDDKHVIGSPLYMAPEQAEGDPDATGAADIYALAGIAYKIMSGTPPFAIWKPVRLMAAHVKAIPPRLSERCPDIPKAVDELLFRCLAKDPLQRPRADEVATTIGQYIHGAVPAPDTASQPLVELVESPWRAFAGPRDVASEVLERPVPQDPEGRGLALATTIMSLVEEIATYLSVSDPELTSLLRFEARISEQLASLERDLALIRTRIDGAPDSLELSKHHDALLERVRTLNAQQLPLQRRMVQIVEAYRPYATGAMKSLFVQMDRALQELARLRRQFP